LFKPPFIPAFLLALAAAGPHAHALTQTEALAQAAAVQKQGSDESLQNSTTNAMRAMLALGNKDQPAAMQHGYKAFGEYRTSQDLDIERVKSRIHQIDMFTNTIGVDSKVPTNLPQPEVFYTTYSRLDPAFLRTGEAKQVADEFEKQSGMKRETFLKKMAQVSETPLSSDDPNLTSKVLKKFSRFLEDIPNEEFRARVQAQIDEASPKTRADVILTGAKHVYEWLAKNGISFGAKPALLQAAATATGGGEADRAPASETASTATAGTPHGRAEDPLNGKKDFSRYMAPTDSGFRGADREKFGNDEFGTVLQAAVDLENETLFTRVSKRYRDMAPSLVHWNIK
jgi:hypothetical protein